MRCLLFCSVLLLLAGCSSVFKGLQPATGDAAVLQKFKPVFSVALYKTNAEVVGNHLSGLLLIKKMPDSSTRIVFSNEMGFTFFDFEFSATGGFKVFSIIQQMDKKAVVKTLRKDFELIMMKDITSPDLQVRKGDNLLYYTFPQSKGYYHYITDLAGGTLIKMERSSKRKIVMEAIMKDYTNGIPDTIGITHRNVDFTIGLKKVIR